MRELIPRVNAQACGGLAGAEVWKESGGSSTDERCSEATSIFTTEIDEDGSDAALATKHATTMEPPSGIFELSR